MNDNERDGLQEIIDKALEEMAREAGEPFDIERINLAEFCRRTKLSRSRARTLKAKGFKVGPHGRCGMKAPVTVLTGYTGTIDDMLRRGVTNSEAIFGRIEEQGYTGGRTTVKNYITANSSLVPAKRKLAVAPQGNRGRRFSTAPGEAYQMDWGFVNVEDWCGRTYRLACFAMICHHCGTCYIEFFPNARQENLFIGMIHAFHMLGIPKTVLTDNMKSVVIRRDIDGRPVWQTDYAAFMKAVGVRDEAVPTAPSLHQGEGGAPDPVRQGQLLGGTRLLGCHRPQRERYRMVRRPVRPLQARHGVRAGR